MSSPWISYCANCSSKGFEYGFGLCRPCYHDREVRQYFKELTQAQKKQKQETRQAPPPEPKPMVTRYKTPRPTKALPGSEEKILVMQARYLAGEQIFHEEDGRQ